MFDDMGYENDVFDGDVFDEFTGNVDHDLELIYGGLRGYRDSRKPNSLRYASRGTKVAIPTEWILPSYTDKNFAKPQTVYLKEGYKLDTEGYCVAQGSKTGVADYNYSDRLIQHYGYEKDRAARKWVDESLPVWSPAALEQWLRALTDNPNLELVHIMASFNASNGHAYQVFGYIEHKGL